MLNKTAFITGSNGDIGKSIITKLIKKKFKVICQIRKKDNEFKNFLSLFKKSSIEIVNFDLTDDKKMTKEISKLYKKNITIDLLVNCAGTASGSLFEMTKIEEIKRVFNVNFFSQLKIIQALLRLLKKSQRPSIINIGSIMGIIPERGTIAYGSSKASLMFSTKIMANEFSNYNIRVNSVAPSITKTKMLDKMDKNVIKRIKEENYKKKICNPSDIAELVYFLSTKNSEHINGQVIRIDGGMKI